MPRLDLLNDPEIGIVFEANPDTQKNSHGKILHDLCSSMEICPLNHLSYQNINFEGKLTFRQREGWISQIDWILCSKQFVPHVKSFEVLQQIPIKTNHAAVTCTLSVPPLSAELILKRANTLDAYPELKPNNRTSPIKFHMINKDVFIANLPDPELLWSTAFERPEESYNMVKETIYKACKLSKDTSVKITRNPVPNLENRWQAIINENDPKKLWAAIGWNGSVFSPATDEKPSNRQFKEHFEALLQLNDDDEPPDTGPPELHIPVLDDQILPDEVIKAIHSLKKNTAPGIDGIPCGIFTLLNDEWILFLTFMFNQIFDQQISYPEEWNLEVIHNFQER